MKYATPELMRQTMPAGYQIYMNYGSRASKIQRAVDQSSQTFGWGPRAKPLRTIVECANAAVEHAWRDSGLSPTEVVYEVTEENLAAALGREAYDGAREQRCA